MLVSLILYSAHSGSSSSYPEIEVLDGGCLMYNLQSTTGFKPQRKKKKEKAQDNIISKPQHSSNELNEKFYCLNNKA